MYALIETGGKQYKVEADKWIDVEKLAGEDGSEVEFDKVLMVKNDSETKLGSPYVEGAKVKGKILKQVKGKKLVVFKMRSKTRYRKKAGHRQKYTRVMIENITA